jgi:hypothetical protein
MDQRRSQCVVHGRDHVIPLTPTLHFLKITLTWTPSSSSLPTNFVLADSPANIPLTNFKINGSRNIQETQFFRATARSFYDRGNRKTEISFDTTRMFADRVSAESFMLMHETQFPSQIPNILVTFVAGVSGGGSTASRYLPNAAIQSVASSLSGCTTRHSYRISGGIMTTTPN